MNMISPGLFCGHYPLMCSKKLCEAQVSLPCDRLGMILDDRSRNGKDLTFCHFPANFGDATCIECKDVQL